MVALSKIGGLSITNGTTRILTRIMTDELASQFSYKGRSSRKSGFEHLHLCEVAKGVFCVNLYDFFLKYIDLFA